MLGFECERAVVCCSSSTALPTPLIPAARSRSRRSAHRERDLEEAVLYVPNMLVNSGVHACHAYSCSRVSLDSEPTCTTDLADEHEHVERAGLGQVHHDGEVHDAQAPAPATSSCGDLVQHQDQYAKAVQHQEDGQRARDEQQQHRSGRRDGRTPRDRASEPARSSRRARATRPTAAGQRLRAVQSFTNNGLLACTRVVCNICVRKPPSSAAVGAAGTGCTAHMCSGARR